MKKTISLLALMMLFSTYCLAHDNTGPESEDFDTQFTEQLLIHAIDCSEWVNEIPDEVEPMHIDPANQLDLRIDEMEWDNENFHFNYLLHPCSDEACYRQASLRFRQQTGHDFGDMSLGRGSDFYILLWCIETCR